jgi:hypothetical protein
MGTEIKIWEVVNDRLTPMQDTSLAENHLEKELETWILENPAILGEDLLIIDRQRYIEGVGRLDLLCIDRDGGLVIVEIKRDRTPREAVAQALDYASWLDSASEEEIQSNAEQFLNRSLEEAFDAHFQQELPELANRNHRIILVAPRLDASAERIINYLSDRYDVDINAVFFKYSKSSGGTEILARSLLVADDVRPMRRRRKNPTLDAILVLASERNTTNLLEIARGMKTVWRETFKGTYGGSVRYWASTASGQNKMVFGVNVSGKNDPPSGQLDVWIPIKSLSEITGISENEIKNTLCDSHPVLDCQPVDCWVRLKSRDEARKLESQLKDWTKTKPMQLIAKL